jgi:hypothetical protein
LARSRGLTRGTSVTVHLELSRDEQPRIDRILAGRAGAEPPHDGMWVDPFQSGRSSQGMWKLLLELGELARRTGRVRVQAIDPGGDVAQVRDRGMADAVIDDMRVHTRDVHLALVGNVHSRLERGVPWDEKMEPFARLVKASGLPVTSLLGTYSGGTIWACSTPKPESCGPMDQKASADDTGAAPSLRLEAQPVRGGHSGVAFVGALHLSPPATSAPAAASGVAKGQ